MREYNITSCVTVLEWDEMTKDDRELMLAAKDATRTSYAPYSDFHVGAAARLSNGLIIRGSNQENASYPLSLCAERTCLFAAGAQHPDQPVIALAIAARRGEKYTTSPIPPCGACRQVILETEDRYQQPIRVLMYGTEGTHIIQSIRDILPLQFLSNSMQE